MLYDRRWDSTVTELDSIIAWLKMQRPGRRYQTRFALTCLFGRYARASGVGRKLGWFEREISIGRESNRLIDNYRRIAAGGPKTYGAALERARELRGW